VAELADAYGSGPYGATRGGSSPLASKISPIALAAGQPDSFSRRPGQQERRDTSSNRPTYLPAPFLLAAHRAFINWESRFRPAGVIPPFFTAGVAFVRAFILAQRALAAAASLARVAAGIGWRRPLAVAELAREPARIEERRFCRVSICRRIETASCRASTDISIPCHIAGVGCDGKSTFITNQMFEVLISAFTCY
jgi:hypothetical protein